VYLKNLSISNLRSIASADIRFCHPGGEDPPELENVTLLLGDNGVGKTTVLRAVALATLSPVIESSGFTPFNLIRRTRAGASSRAELRAEVQLHAQDLAGKGHDAPLAVEVETAIERRHDVERVLSPPWSEDIWEEMFVERSAAFLVVGYSAGRRVESATSFDSGVRSKSRRIRYQRVAGLFEEGVTLTPLNAWLPEFKGENPGRYSQVITLINDLLPEGTRISGERENGEYLFEHNETRVPFAAMSDGYRAYIGWIADLLYHVCMGAPKGKKLVDNRGIVLVDEIDLHLHPAWQREVIPQLARTLPNLQFVLTTHSPIVAGTLQAKNIRVIEPDETGASTIQQLNERIHGLNADQILVSSYFGLDSTRAPEAVDALQALSRKARHGDRDAVHAFLSRLSNESEAWEQDEAGAGETSAPAAGGSRTASGSKAKASGRGSSKRVAGGKGKAPGEGSPKSAAGGKKPAKGPAPKRSPGRGKSA
jgi:hypothetical protein